MSDPLVVYDQQAFEIQAVGGVSRYFCELARRVNDLPGFRSRIVAPVHMNEHLADLTTAKIGLYLPKGVPKTGFIYRTINKCLSPIVNLALRPAILHRTYYAPGPLPKGARLVVTVHDMIHALYPQHFRNADRSVAQQKATVAEADAIIAVSANTARDLQRMFSVPSERIAVVHHGFSRSFQRSDAAPLVSANSSRPYLLYVGHRAGHKNFTRLLTAYAASPRLARDFDLVAFGGPAWNAGELALLKSLRVRADAVRRRTGPDGELAKAYAEAAVFVYPSEYEGFGIPILEAMSSGCPVACSSTSSMPEVAGEAAEFFDPFDIDSIQAGIELVAYDQWRRAALIEAGVQRSKVFSWDQCAQGTVEVYRRLL